MRSPSTRLCYYCCLRLLSAAASLLHDFFADTLLNQLGHYLFLFPSFECYMSNRAQQGPCLLRIFFCLFAFLVLHPFPLPTFRISYFFLASIKSWATYTGHERQVEIEPTILDEINETSGPPLPQLQCCQNGAFLLFRAFASLLWEEREKTVPFYSILL